MVVGRGVGGWIDDVDAHGAASITAVPEWTRGDGYVISTDRSRLDLATVHRYLSEEAYWSPGVPREHVERAIAGSLAFGLFAPGGSQVGFARVVTDYAQIAWLGDVFVLEAHRGKGLGVWLLETVLGHPDLQTLRVFILKTADAHSLYERFGFERVTDTSRFMERRG